ncbi:MAG: glycosyltransferase family 4 protein [Flavobacteriales bacterium]|nr:glycosyltransferase family 4 protein [Flavobacteriales bacterium]
MRIAVNTRLLLADKLEGIGWFAHETLSRITKAHPEHTFLFLFDRPYDPRFVYGPNVIPIVVPPPTRHPLLYRLWFGLMVPRILRKHKADLFLSPDGFLSLSTDVPQLSVMHDLNFEHYPEDLPAAYSRYYRSFFPRFAQKAARIVTVSEFSKQDIVKHYAVPDERIDVVHNGVSAVYAPLVVEEQRLVREQRTGGAPYLICVGSMHARKNVARLLLAFDRIAAEQPALRLVFVGEQMFHDPRMEEAWAQVKHKDRVVFTGRLGQKELRRTLGAAMALVYVSYFEGFGIPVAEAMKCGVPVVCANATSLPEVAGDAALYCDPFNVDDIAQAMRTITSDPSLRERLSAAGLQRAERYTWDRTAEGLWASVERMMKDQRTT